MYNTYHERALDKAYSRIEMLRIQVRDAIHNIETDSTGAITKEEWQLLKNGYELDLNTWNYIMHLIEANEQ